ncbi:MAG: hypothetical protein ACXWK9_04210, partial [Myxococcaceae bacterium]
DVEPGDPANATPASLGVLLSGAWQYYGDLDCFAFDLTERPALAEFDAGVLRIFYSNGTVGWLYGPGWFDTLGGGRIVLCMDLPNDGGLRGLTTYPYTLRVTSP